MEIPLVIGLLDTTNLVYTWFRKGSLPGRPAHETAAQDMEMEVVDGLSSIISTVDHSSKSGLVEVEALGCLGNGRQCSAENGGIGNVYQGIVMRLRNQENMHGSLGIQVPKRHELPVFINGVDGNLLPRDLAKNAVFFHSRPRSSG